MAPASVEFSAVHDSGLETRLKPCRTLKIRVDYNPAKSNAFNLLIDSAPESSTILIHNREGLPVWWGTIDELAAKLSQ